MNKPAIRSVANAFSILEHVLECSMISEGVELAEIARKFGMQKTTARNMMQTLEYCGYVKRTARGIYNVGEKCSMLSKAGRFAEKIRECSVGILKRAAENTGESFILTTLFNGQRLIVASVSGNSVISVNPEAIEKEQKFNYERVTTRVLLAWCSDFEREQFLAVNGAPEERSWREASGSSDRLMAEIEKIRKNGFCENAASNAGTFYALALPVFDSGNNFIAAVGVFSPCFRTDDAKKELLRNTLKEVSSYIKTQI